MAYSEVQSATANSTSGSTLGKAFTTTTITVGNAIVVVGFASASATPNLTVSDSAGNTYTPLVSNVDATNGVQAVTWSAPITVGGGTKPTVTISNGGAGWFGALIDIAEVSGIQTGASSIDSTAKRSNTASSTTPSSPAASPATGAANEYGVGSYADPFGAGLVKGASWNDLGTVENGGVTASGEWADSGAAGSTPSANWTLTSGAPYTAAIVVIKLAAVGPPPPTLYSNTTRQMRRRV